MREVLKQAEHRPQAVSAQIAILKAVNEGLLDDIELDDIADVEYRIQQDFSSSLPGLCVKMEAGEAFDDSEWQHLNDAATATIRAYRLMTQNRA